MLHELAGSSARFWSKVDKSGGPTVCWLWTAGTSQGGYGTFSVNRKTYRSHRVAYILTYGDIEPRPGYHGTVVRHTCDNTRCCNPSHMLLGSQTENCQDRVDRGRGVSLTGDAWAEAHPPNSLAYGARNGAYTKPECRPKGVSHGCAKLTEEQVREIRTRASAGASNRSLAREFNVASVTVDRIVSRKKWTHLE